MSDDDKLDAILAQMSEMRAEISDTREAVVAIGNKLLGMESKIDGIAQATMAPAECMALGIRPKEPFLKPVKEEA